MKKRMSKFLSLPLSLVLILSLALPAFAFEDTDPPQWEVYGYNSLEEMLADWEITEEEYYDLFVADLLEYQQYQEELDARRQTWLDAHPNEAAAFDPYAYFAEKFSYYDSPEEYMKWYELTEDEFRQEMLDNWVENMLYQEERQTALAQAKVDRGGSAQGINVMVNGVCIPFPDVRPEIKNDRTMVPLAAAMEYLGADVSYDLAAHSAAVSLEGHSFTHAIGTNVLDLPGGGTFTMDTASYIKDGRTMVPIAFFAQYLGYEVYWDSNYRTAVLLDRQAAVETIDQEFTLLNRILYTLSGADQYKEGQSLKSTLTMDLDLTLLDSLKGDKKYSMSLDGSSLVNETAANISYTADLKDLFDLLIYASSIYDPAELGEIDSYRQLLSNVDVELIVDLEGQCLYLHSPILAELELVEDSNAWVALPLNGLLDAAALSPTELTVGQLLVIAAFDGSYSPFLAWDNLSTAVSELSSYVGDGRFTKSGSSYILKWDITEEGYYGSSESMSIQLKVTPSGAKSCSYSLTMDLDADVMAADLQLTGSSGKADLDASLHIKNMIKAALEMEARISTTNQKPQSAPPAGEKIEHPAGVVGSGIPEF